MSELRQAGQHPDADQLNAFAEHTLPAHEQEQTLAHLATCPACRQIVTLALPAVDESPMVAAAPVRRFRPVRLVWVAIPALAALILMGIFLRKTEIPSHTTTVAPQIADVRPPGPASARAPAPAPETLPSAPPVAARRSAPQPENQKQEATATGVPGGVMGGILGGIGIAPATPQTNAYANGRASFFPVANLLPSHLAILSMASHANERVAIDSTHQVFFSDDNGRNWKAIPAPWKGHAIRVALAGSAGAPLPMQSPAPRMVLEAAPLAPSTTSATLSGTITDASGAKVQGTTVAAIEFGSVVSNATSDSEGRFRIENLPPGSYRVEAQAPGFEKQSAVTEITPGHPTTVDFTLQVGSMAQSVTVESAHPALDTVLITPPPPALAQFELTTDDGQSWVSDDGQAWRPK